MSPDPRTRIRLVSGGIFLLAALVVTRLFYIQIVHGDFYRDRADRQYAAPAGSSFDRGSVFFKERNGNLISAASLKSGFTLILNPQKLTDAEAAWKLISPIVKLDRDDFMAKAAKQNDPHEELARRLPKESADRISALAIPGIELYKDKWRFYPQGQVASRILGMVGYSGESFGGRYGVERYYENVLARPDSDPYVNFFAEVFANVGDALFKSDLERAGDITLTVEPEVERELHDELLKVKAAWNSDLVGGIIMDPATGAIYAMEVVPGFDPNNLKGVDPLMLANPIVESVYEMGSIMKPLTLAAGLDAGVITAATTYNDTGSVTLNTKTIRNFDGKGRGTVPMQEVLSQSLNTGMVFIAQRLGNDRMREYLLDYGLGEETGIDLPGEVRGLVSNLKSDRDVEFATAAFGQGIAVTPIEAARALAALGNGGVLVEPHLIDTIDYQNGLSKSPEYSVGRRVLKKETSEEITRMLVEVVDKALLGGTVKIPEYSVAAKTGTAQVPAPGGGYYEGRYLHSFFGYFPAYDPKFLIFLYTANPKGATFASHTLTAPFIRLTKFLLNYYEIPPDRPITSTSL